MKKETRVGMVVRYVDGEEDWFVFSRPEDIPNPITRIEEALNASMIILELENRVLLIPMHRVARIEVSPRPDKLPSYALRNVRVMTP